MPLGFGTFFSHTAAQRPDQVALRAQDRTVTFAELDAETNRLARALGAHASAGDVVVVALPNGIEFFSWVLAAWKVGATPLPLSARLPAPDFHAMTTAARAAVVVGSHGMDPGRLAAQAASLSDDPLADVPVRSWKIIGSGGSTGRPKLIVDHGDDPQRVADGVAALRMEAGDVHLLAGPLYHNAPFYTSMAHLLVGGTVEIMERFDAGRFLDLVEARGVNWTVVVPTMLHRILRLPEEQRSGRRLDSLRMVLHTAAPCPEWVKRGAIGLFGADVLCEFFGTTETGLAGGTMICGADWLEHPGSVGSPYGGAEMVIRDEDGRPLPTGEIGLIWVRPANGFTFSYLGAEARIEDGFMTAGDLGFLDAEGYLHIADRRVDLVITGGANVYPAEVEAALSEHPAVVDAVVIGLPDDEWGQRVHAIVAAPDTSTEELDRHCRARLAAYKVPRSYELVDEVPRDPSGKIQRSRLREERLRTPRLP